MTKDEALSLALRAMVVNNQAWKYLADSGDVGNFDAEEQGYYQLNEKAITAIKAALEAKDEPVAWRTFDGEGGYDYHTYEYNEDYAVKWDANNPKHKGWVEPLFTTPPQRTWVGLTDEEVTWLCNTAKSHEQTWGMFVRAIEAKLKEKNT